MDSHECSASGPADKPKSRPQPAKGRSRLSNSIFRLPGLNGNSRAGRRHRDAIKAALADIGKAERELSETEREQVRTLGLLTLRLDALQERGLSGEVNNELELGIVRLTNSLARLRWQLGIGKRRRNTLAPEDPLDYARRKRREAI
jgi:hypothetical protein